MFADIATDKEEVAHQHARNGWRLMRISVPEIGAGKDWGLTFERDSDEVATAASVPISHT